MHCESFLLLRLRCGRGDEESEVTVFQYMDVTASSDMVEVKLSFNYMRSITAEQRDHSVCRKELEGGGVNVGW